MFEILTDENAVLYAVKAYEKPNCIRSEFDDDFKRFRYLSRLFRRYSNKGELRERLILNHLVVLYNVFGPEAGTRLLFFYIRPAEYSVLKTFLLFLNYMPSTISGIRHMHIHSADISVDLSIAGKLRALR